MGTLVQLANALSHLGRVIDLLKPGGYLIIEDLAKDPPAGIKGSAAGVRAAFTALDAIWKSNGQDPQLGQKYEAYLKGHEHFNEADVQVHTARLPLNTPSPGQPIVPVHSMSRSNFAPVACRPKDSGLGPHYKDILDAFALVQSFAPTLGGWLHFGVAGHVRQGSTRWRLGI